MSHLTVAVNERSAQALFDKLRDNLHASTSDSGSFGPFTASYAAGFRLEGGTLDFQSNGTVLVSELDIVYDPLSLTLGIDIPEICVGGFCIIPTPFGCALRVPRICVFSADPDIALPIDLGGLIVTELSGAFAIRTNHFTDPARTPSMTDLDAEDAGHPDKWQFFLDPIWLDVDLIDIADTVGNILDAAISAAVDALLGFLPGWVRDLVEAILGSLVDVIRAILDIPDDIGEWLSNLLGVSLGLFNAALTIVADYFAAQYPLFEFEDPFPILEATPTLIPVKIPVDNVAVQVTDTEMVLSADVGS
jgi:hypothetical protein